MQRVSLCYEYAGYLQLSLTRYKPITLTQKIVLDQGTLTLKKIYRVENFKNHD